MQALWWYTMEYTATCHLNLPLGECISWDMPWYITRERCITSLYHALENTVTNTVNVTYAWRMMGRLDVTPSNIRRLSYFLIGCIFYGIKKTTV